MKKITVLVVLAALLAAMFCVPVSAAEDAVPLTGEEINVYNWGLYISDGTDGYIDVNKEFTRRTGIKVNYTEYESNEALYAKLKTGGVSYDVIIPSDYMIAKLVEEDMLLPLDYENIPNASLVEPDLLGRSFDPENKYCVPYTMGMTGLIYNTKYVTGTVDSWGVLWDEQYAGKVMMFDNSRDAFAIAAMLLGYDVNTTDPDEIQAMADKLAQQKPLVHSYVMDQVYDAMQQEEAWIAPYYAGDYLQMSDGYENLAFCFPKEGYNLFIEAMCIPTCSQNKKAAEAYINFLCDPEISGKNMSYLGYATPIIGAKAYLDEDMANSDIVYPDGETISRGLSFENLPTETVQSMNDLFNKVKTANSGWSLYVIGGVAVVVAVAGVWFFVRRKKRNDY